MKKTGTLPRTAVLIKSRAEQRRVHTAGSCDRAQKPAWIMITIMQAVILHRSSSYLLDIGRGFPFAR